MAKLSVKQIQEAACGIVAENPGGIRYTNLVQQIIEEHPDTPSGTIFTSVSELAAKYPHRISKPSRGLYVPGNGEGTQATTEPAIAVPDANECREEKFYAPFADWLKNELDEVTVAEPLGGAGLRKKWGTPDVVGVYKPLASHLIKFPVEIVAAEIKIDPTTPVVAFGQAAAYRLFAAKSYVVMPQGISQEDYSRLEALCMLFGIGLVLFATNPDQPNFEIRVRAQKFSPDMFYVNEFAERLCQLDASMFNRLFGG